MYDITEQRAGSFTTFHASGGWNDVSEEVRLTHESPAAAGSMYRTAAKTVVASRRDKDLSMTFKTT